ncbi:hypothetical protein JCM8547_005738 [Rhodosporidiobolus lusitaniae]
MPILEQLSADGTREEARVILDKCSRSSKQFLRLAKPLLEHHRAEKLTIVLTSIYHEVHGSIKFLHHALDPSCGLVSMDEQQMRKLRFIEFKTDRRQPLCWGSWDSTTSSRLGVLFDSLAGPVSVSLPVKPRGLSNSNEVEKLFPLYDRRAEPRKCITELHLHVLHAQDLLGLLRYFPHLRSLVLESYGRDEVPLSVFQEYELRPLAHLALTSLTCNWSISPVLTLFSSSLTSLEVKLRTYDGTVAQLAPDLSQLDHLKSLTFLLEKLAIWPKDRTRTLLLACLTTSSTSPVFPSSSPTAEKPSSPTASSFTVTLKPHKRSYGTATSNGGTKSGSTLRAWSSGTRRRGG